MVCWVSSGMNTQPRSNSRARVLLVDDSPTTLYLLRSVFEGEQYDVVTASDGMEGLDAASRYAPDLIVTDSIMPGVDGFALLRRLRENPATRLIPVIMLTSADSRESERQHNDCRPDVFITKSAAMEPLLRQVQELLKR
jgi:CheY-like chemotaxis protein